MANRVVIRKIHTGTDSHGKYQRHKGAVQLVHDGMTGNSRRADRAALGGDRDDDLADPMPTTIDHARGQLGRPTSIRMNSSQTE